MTEPATDAIPKDAGTPVIEPDDMDAGADDDEFPDDDETEESS